MQVVKPRKDTSDCRIMVMMYGSETSRLKYWINKTIDKDIPAHGRGYPFFNGIFV